jgi:hypothetical protein
MKVYKHLQSIFNKRDVQIIEEEIEIKPILCSTCFAPAVGMSIRYYNTTDAPSSVADCEKVEIYYCKEHQPKEGFEKI